MIILSTKNLSKKYFGAAHNAVDNVFMELSRGKLLALIGESASGKTTLLRMIAGLEIPSEGEISINGRIVFDYKTFVPPEKRGVGMVFQEYALFPHFTIAKNIGFGLHRLPKSQREDRIRQMLALIYLPDCANRYPHELSGGEQQRVALARALAPNPALLLLDEPFSNLDENLKSSVRTEVRTIIAQTETTAILVTHDTKDALSIADKIAILKNGRVQQIDSPEMIYNYPKTVYVANFFGKTNLIKATAVDGGFDTPIGFIADLNYDKTGRNITLSIRPEDFEITSENSESRIKGKIKQVVFHGGYKELLLSISNGKGNPSYVTLHNSTNTIFKPEEYLFFKPQKGKIRLIQAPDNN